MILKKELKKKKFYEIGNRKKAIIDCLDENLFSFAQSSINRINEFQDEIHTLNSKMS